MLTMLLAGSVCAFWSCSQESEEVAPTQDNGLAPTKEVAANQKRAIDLNVNASLTDDYKISFRVSNPVNASGTFFRWNFGDGQTVITREPNVVHQYMCKRANYNVQVLQDHPIGYTFGRGTTSVLAKNDGGAILPFTISKQKTEPWTIKFTANGGEGCHNNRAFTWEFGDDSPPKPSWTNTKTHKFPAQFLRTYTVKVTMRDLDGNLISGPATTTVRFDPPF